MRKIGLPAGIQRLFPLSDRGWLGVILAVFILSRALYWVVGVRFYSWSETHLMHFISADLLRSDLLRSVFFLHTQPPLFNLFRGLVFKLFPGDALPVFNLVFLTLGALLTVSLFLLMRKLGGSGRLSAGLTVLFMVSPACILYENTLLYPYPVTTLLCLSALVLYSSLRSGGFLNLTIFFSLLAIVILTRSSFHLIWFAACAVLLLVFQRQYRKRILLAAAVPFLLVFSLYMKNWYLFGNFSSSTWIGMSLCKMTTARLPEETRAALVGQGRLSELSLLPPFKSLWFYSSRVNVPRFEKTGAAVLDMEFYPEVGNNWNNLAYVSISNQYARDVKTVLKTHPRIYLRSLTDSFRIFFFPASDWFHSNPKFDNLPIAPMEKLFNTFFSGQFFRAFFPVTTTLTYNDYSRSYRGMGLFLLLGFLIALVYGFRRAYMAWKGNTPDPATALTLLYMVGTILYATLVGNLLEVGENNRFRFDVDPFILVITGLFLTRMTSGIPHFFTKANGTPSEPDDSPQTGLQERPRRTR